MLEYSLLRKPCCSTPGVAVDSAAVIAATLLLLDVFGKLLLLLLDGASKLMRAPRLYWGVALNRSLSICMTVDISRLGRPKRSCSAGFSVPENVPE